MQTWQYVSTCIIGPNVLFRGLMTGKVQFYCPSADPILRESSLIVKPFIFACVGASYCVISIGFGYSNPWFELGRIMMIRETNPIWGSEDRLDLRSNHDDSWRIMVHESWVQKKERKIVIRDWCGSPLNFYILYNCHWQHTSQMQRPCKLGIIRPRSYDSSRARSVITGIPFRLVPPVTKTKTQMRATAEGGSVPGKVRRRSYLWTWTFRVCTSELNCAWPKLHLYP